MTKYGYSVEALKGQAHKGGAPRMPKLAPQASERMLDINMRRIMRVAATRASIAKHHTIQLDYVVDAARLATGLSVLGFRIPKEQRKAKSAKKRSSATAAKTDGRTE